VRIAGRGVRIVGRGVRAVVCGTRGAGCPTRIVHWCGEGREAACGELLSITNMLRKNIIVLLVLLAAFAGGSAAQDLPRYKRIVKELCSPKYRGRGYTDDGVRKAGRYIENAFRRAGADEVTTQSFSIDINTFPGDMALSVDGRPLEPGREFVMREYSPGVHGTFRLFYIDTANYDSDSLFAQLERPENWNAMVVCDFWFSYKHGADFGRLQTFGECRNAGLIFVWDTPLKFYKAYGERVVDKPVLWVSQDFPKEARQVTAAVDHRYLQGYESENVIAKVAGRRHDSCYVFSAHYDHLGLLGRDLYYPGANDNASGTAAIITLAAHYAKHRPEFDIYFIAFAGEETGLRGSTYLADHPTFDLSRVKYLFNLDMIGDDNPVQYCEVSDAGLAGFAKMEALNASRHYFAGFDRGKLAGNSDHYPFALEGVPCVLFENQEGTAFARYHTAEDGWKSAIFTTYPKIFGLVTDFVAAGY